MKSQNAIFSDGTLRFFRELERNNAKAWMDENREWYRSSVVDPFRAMLDALTPAALHLDPNFEIDGRTGTNFSRINRDIRFARDKTPYRTQMYLFFCGRNSHGGELYVGLGPKFATAGFRIYAESRDKTSAIEAIARPRVAARPKFLAQQKRRLGRRYESYWYSMEKREWTKHSGWPLDPADWKKLLAWIVRRKMPAKAATRPTFAGDAAKIFREVFPLYEFTSLAGSKRRG
ncbi:MAG: DUF2461 family protein [Candidatus Acidiferrales bacterium]